MDTTQDRSSRQATALPGEDLRLLLRSSFRLFLRRLSHNVAVRREDLERILPYVDDSAEGRACH